MNRGNLTARKAAIALPGKHWDGAGLLLIVSKHGSRSWVFRFKINGRSREMGLGSYPKISLAQARNKAFKNRMKVKSGIDPIEERTNARTGLKEIPNFTQCSARYILTYRNGWKNNKHARQWVRTIKTYVRPKIGTNLVNAINTENILDILKPIWDTKTETAKRVQGRIENILDYAAAHGYRGSINPARWKGHLDKLLPIPTKVRKSVHHPAMLYTQVPDFMKELTENNSISSLALRFLILTATRTSEVLQAQWGEIDLTTAIWTIPIERMKAQQEHRVPLSDAALTILNNLYCIKANEFPYLFPSTHRGITLSNMALLRLMRNMGYGVNGSRGNYVPHGFRSSFRDWAGEISNFPLDVAEMALAHTIKNKVEAAYRRGDLLDKRRLMMQQWADYVSANKIGTEEISPTPPTCWRTHNQPIGSMPEEYHLNITFKSNVGGQNK